LGATRVPRYESGIQGKELRIRHDAPAG